MDTIFEFIGSAFKKVTVNPNQEMTANPNQDLENLEERDIEFINQEMDRLNQIESQRPLTPSEDERMGMLLFEEIRRDYDTEESRNKAAKLEQDTNKFKKKLAETPSKFKEGQWVKLKTGTVTDVLAGTEGIVLDVFTPDFDLYIEKDIFMYDYMVEIHAKHPEFPSRIIYSGIPIVDEDQLEAAAKRNRV